MTTCDRRAFAQAFLDAHPDAKHGHYYSRPYNTALREHRERVLDGLRSLFGVTLDFDGVPDYKACSCCSAAPPTHTSRSPRRAPGSGKRG